MTDTAGTTGAAGAMPAGAGGEPHTAPAAAGKHVRMLIVLRAVLILAFGLAVLLVPGIALLALIYTFAAYALVDGVTAVVLGVGSRGSRPGWGWTVAQGVVSVIAGVVAFALPAPAALALLFVIAFWAIVAGVVTAMAANTVRRHDGPWGWIALRSALNLLFGVALLVWPASGILAMLWLVGWFAVVTGIALGVQAFRSESHPAVG